MITKIEKLPKSKIKLTVTIPGKDVAPYYDKAIDKLGQSIEIKGFRPGKAPKNLLVERIGDSRIVTQALEYVLPETYSEAAKEKEISPVATPEIKIEKYPVFGDEGEDLVYSAEVDVFPEIKLGDYKKIKVKQKDFQPKEIKDEDVDKVIDYLKKQRAKFNKVDRGAKFGDRVEIDFNGSIDGVEQEGMVSKNHPLILGEKTLIPGFEEELVDLKSGEEKEFDITFPKDYHSKDYANKKARFKVKMNTVEEMEMPELNDKLAKDLGHNSVEALKKAINENLVEEEKMTKQNALEGEVVAQSVKLLEAEVPQSFVENEINRMLEDTKQRVMYQGLDYDTYLQYIKKTEEELKHEMTPHAEQSVRIGLMIGEIIRREEIDPKDKEAPKKAVEKLVGYATK
jgi:trigger factor